MATASTIETARPGAREAGHTLVLRRVLKAAPERVFRAWTEPGQLARWLGPPGYTCPTHELDARPGGAYRIVMRSPEGEEHTVSGTYTQVDPPRRLAFTWGSECAGGRAIESAVDLAFSAHPDGTLLVLTHRRLPTVESRDSHARGWAGCLDSLTAFLAGG